MTRLMNSGTFGQAFGGKFNSQKSRSVYRFPGVGGDGQASVFAGGGYAAQQPIAVRTPTDFAAGIANLGIPKYQAVDTWKSPENVYQGILDSMAQAQQQSAYQGGQSAASGGGGQWSKGSGSGLGLSAYGFKGTTGTPDLKGTGKLGTQQVFSDALDSMFADMERSGLGRPSITDGFRSYAGQVAAKKKWAAKGKPNMAATPGRSIHGLGLAVDLGLSTAQYQWMKRNAAKYNIVNLPSESWHWQYSSSAWANRNKTASSAPSRQVMS